MISLRVVLAMAASYGWKLWQLDVKNAFLYGELDKDIYMEQPPGYVSNLHLDYVCKLKKTLYGLKQAPRAWYGKLLNNYIFVAIPHHIQILACLLRNKKIYMWLFSCTWMT